MCGICGIVNLNPDHPADEGILIAMRDSLSHRGPDGNGLFIQRNVGLGHTRLSIIDLATGSQPMHNEDSSVWIVFNGEIYNFVELRSELQDRGHTFTTTSDTETLLHLY